MRLLILGGSGFVGRALAAEGVARGWDVTVFNRGTRPSVPGVTILTGDRQGDPPALTGDWDLVADTWSADPAAVEKAATALADHAGHYTYISSVSVYREPLPAGSDESAPLVTGPSGYAEDKANAERAVTSVFGDRALLVRAGLILGPWEDIGRLPWWLTRIARGGRVLAPGPQDSGLQFVDVRDLAAWTLAAAEDGRGGPYNVASAPGHTTMRALLETCREVTGSDAELVWRTPEEILAAGVQPWTQLPIWLPPGEDYDAVQTTNVSKALAVGLRCRPAAETVADTWAWLRGLDGPPPQRRDRPAPGLDPAVEERLLAR